MNKKVIWPRLPTPSKLVIFGNFVYKVRWEWAHVKLNIRINKVVRCFKVVVLPSCFSSVWPANMNLTLYFHIDHICPQPYSCCSSVWPTSLFEFDIVFFFTLFTFVPDLSILLIYMACLPIWIWHWIFTLVTFVWNLFILFNLNSLI